MAHRAMRTRARVGGGLRQRTDWVRLVSTADQTILPGVKTLLSTVIPLVSAVTVRRTLLQFSIQSDQEIAAEDQLGAIGMYVAGDPAVAVGATALLGPGTDASDDVWFLWAPFVQRSATGAAGTFAGKQYNIDSRGQRKFESGQTVVLMVENVGSFGLLVTFAFSMLLGAGLQR